MVARVKLKPEPGRGTVRKFRVVDLPKGSLAEAVIRATEAVGEDGNGNGGLVGYCRRQAAQHPKEFASLLKSALRLCSVHVGPEQTTVISMEQE